MSLASGGFGDKRHHPSPLCRVHDDLPAHPTHASGTPPWLRAALPRRRAGHPIFGLKELAETIAGVVAAAIWWLYLNLSERVKNTFVT